MKEFSLVYNNIVLNVICDEYIERLIKDHFKNHLTFSEYNSDPTYTLIISEKISKPNGKYYRMIDKWFDNATLDCYIDNSSKICFSTNFQASTLEYKNLLIQYFVANLFNRFLEIEGYLGVHSSCVEQNGKGVLFVAGRNSGKTICMLNLMNNGFNSVTNDKIALKYNGQQMVGYGIAQSVSIRLSPEFCAQPENQKYVKLALERGIDIKNQNMLEGNNIVLNDNELADLNNVNQVFDTSISCIITPTYDPYIDKPVFQRLKSEQVRNLIVDQYMSLVHDTTTFFRDIHLGREINRNITLDNVINIPSYSCRQNENTTREFTDTIRKLVLKK